MIKDVSKYIYNVTKDLYSKKISFQLILKKKYHGFHKIMKHRDIDNNHKCFLIII